MTQEHVSHKFTRDKGIVNQSSNDIRKINEKIN